MCFEALYRFSSSNGSEVRLKSWYIYGFEKLLCLPQGSYSAYLKLCPVALQGRQHAMLPAQTNHRGHVHRPAVTRRERRSL